MVRRFIAPLHTNLLGTKSWCTGEDSNLRTSLGGTDLQSVGFNHSPTCAELLRRRGRRGPHAAKRSQAASAPGNWLGRQLQNPQSNPTRPRPLFAIPGSQGPPKKTPRRPLYAGKVPNGVRWKTCCAATESAARREFFVLWSWRRDSNPRPSDYKSDALPTELRQQAWDKCASAQTYPSDPFHMSGTIY